MTNFEIILIILKIINKIKKTDHRIKIINKSKNIGTLYSRSIAVLISRDESTHEINYIYIYII